jgi:hypothetical protein
MMGFSRITPVALGRGLATPKSYNLSKKFEGLPMAVVGSATPNGQNLLFIYFLFF